MSSNARLLSDSYNDLSDSYGVSELAWGHSSELLKLLEAISLHAASDRCRQLEPNRLV